MSPDFLLRCTACGREAAWDTEALPPVGVPEIGHPVLWWCDGCGREQRHTIQRPFVIADKLHHEICVATETDRATVDRVMEEMSRYRQRMGDARLSGASHAPDAVENVAETAGVPPEVVANISAAETAWMVRRGYFQPTADE